MCMPITSILIVWWLWWCDVIKGLGMVELWRWRFWWFKWTPFYQLYNQLFSICLLECNGTKIWPWIIPFWISRWSWDPNSIICFWNSLLLVPQSIELLPKSSKDMQCIMSNPQVISHCLFRILALKSPMRNTLFNSSIAKCSQFLFLS